MNRVIWKRGKFELLPTDHFTLIFVLHKLPKKSTKMTKVTKWNFEKEEGWEKYEQLSNKIFDYFIEEINNKESDINRVTKRFHDIHTKIMFGSFGKVTNKIGRPKTKKLIHEKRTRQSLVDRDLRKFGQS